LQILLQRKILWRRHAFEAHTVAWLIVEFVARALNTLLHGVIPYESNFTRVAIGYL